MTKSDKLAQLESLVPVPLPAPLKEWLARQERGTVELSLPGQSSPLLTGVDVLLRHYRGSQRGSARTQTDGDTELYLGHLTQAQDLGYFYLDLRTMDVVERSNDGEEFGERQEFARLFR